MPPNLDIDRTTSLNGTMAPYSQHLVISTGRSDWSSRIEVDPYATLARELKRLMSRGGKYADVCIFVYLGLILLETHTQADSITVEVAIQQHPNLPLLLPLRPRLPPQNPQTPSLRLPIPQLLVPRLHPANHIDDRNVHKSLFAPHKTAPCA